MVAINKHLRLDGADSAPLGHPVFIGNGQRADVLWSAEKVFAIFTRMLQGNPLDFLAKPIEQKTGN